ncbi:MAG TPA: IgGFc-binding protein [Polyangiaceae bacterium]|jgi:hypothetical protein
MRSRAALLALVVACRFDSAYRDVPGPAPVPACTAGQVSCSGDVLEKCRDDQTGADELDDCGSRGLVCSKSLLACASCDPGSGTCDGQTTATCAADGTSYVSGATCDTTQGSACRGGLCVELCQQADSQHSNVGCEYWAADLDNAVESASLNAAAQQYAIVVSNAEPDVATDVTIDEDDAQVGNPASLRTVATATIPAGSLEVFKLGPREVDGSPDGEFNTGTGTALTRHAYRVRSSMPIVAYQFNPLDNANVFSNDASQLLPESALANSAGATSYLVDGWPQTIATSDIPSQNFGTDLRAFVAIVATRPDTHVHVQSTVRVIPGGPLPNGLPAGGATDVVLQPFEVLNLETGGFNADFTGSSIIADKPVAVFPGSEASDAPFYQTLADRFCCADHLEDQLPPIHTVGKRYALSRMPSRSKVVLAAGADIGAIDEPELYRVLAVASGTTHVVTTLPAPDDAFDLTAGQDRVLTAHQDFTLTASQPAIVMDVQVSQQAAGIPNGLPGGDPSTTYVSPVEQWRADYVLLTPDQYNFDFFVISAPTDAQLYLDGLPLDATVCDVGPGDGLTAQERGSATPPFLSYRCQLSFPIIDTSTNPPTISPGKQNDGAHHLQGDEPFGVVVYGFDTFVSYAYAGGTDLKEIYVP